MSSRVQAAKSAAHHKKVQDATAAKNFSGKFTQKQSKFAIRNEEKQLAAAANGGDFNSRPQRRMRGRDYENAPAPAQPLVPAAAPPKPTAMANAAAAGYNPFSPVVRRSSSSGKKAESTSNSAPVHPGFTAQPRLTPQSASTNERRANKYSLNEGNGLGNKRTRDEDSEGQGGIGALLGGHVYRQEDAEAEANQGGVDSKRSKFERFQELIENTRDERAQKHRDKLEKEKQTTFLDAEFDSIMGLLHKRDKIEEDKIAFKTSITPEIQDLLDKYRPAGRVAKKLIISSTPIVSSSSSAVVNSSATIEPLKNPNDKKKAGLTPDSQKLLAQINAKSKDSRAPKEIEKMPLAVSAEVARAMERQALAAKGQQMPSLIGDESGPIGFGDDDVDGANNGGRKIDEFDLLMSRMRSEGTRMAVATDRVLSEEEVAAQQARQELLGQDRAQAPQIDVEQKDMSRKEWLHRGGDLAHQMDDVDEDIDYDYDRNDDEELVYSDDEVSENDKADAEADDDDNAKEDDKKAKGLHAVDEILSTIETKCKEHVARLSRKKTMFEKVEESRMFKQQISDLSIALHEACKKHPHYGVESLRLILINLQKQATAAASVANNKSLDAVLSPYQLLLLFIMLNVFPVSDFRHEVITPLFLFLSATIMQARLRTLNDARVVLCLSSLLADGLARGGQRFAAEPLVGALNVFALQLERTDLEPAKLQGTRLPCPMLSRDNDALLGLQQNHKGSDAAAESERPLPPLVSLTDALVGLAENSANSQLQKGGHKKGSAEFLGPRQNQQSASKSTIDESSEASEGARLSIIASAIKLLTYIVNHFTSNSAGSTAAICDPILHLDSLLQSASKNIERYPQNIADLYEDLLSKVADAKKQIMSYRTPLAMRTFRPRPLRQFDPLLAENESAEVQEHKHLKKVLREDRKRLVRNIQAQATVDRREREREQAVDDARRTEKYNQLMGELQQQAHIMKTVDSFMDKARSKKRKGVSGESKITKKDSDPDEGM